MFSVQEILTATSGKLLSGKEDGIVRGLSIDSRQVKKNQVFVAVKGEIFDGHDFIANVIGLGVKVVVVHKPVVIPQPGVTVILVKDTTKALGDLARSHRQRFKVPVIAITGSAGKTTTKEMIGAVLSKKFNVLKNEGTQNNHIGVPLTLFKLRSSHDVVVMECGTNQPGDILWLADVLRPTAVVFTNIGESHLERLGTPQGVLKEKWVLMKYLPKGAFVIINGDDPLLSKAAAKVSKTHHVIRYGIHRPADLQANAVIVSGAASLRFSVSGKTVELHSCGINNVYNSLAAYACGDMLGVKQSAIASALAGFEFPQGRGQILRLGKGWLLNDAYNANPVSMRSALQTLQAVSVPGKKIAVLADMLELGPLSKQLHGSIGKLAASMDVDVLITVGKLAKEIGVQAKRSCKRTRVVACAEVEGAKAELAKLFENGDAVLVKGSRRMKMEHVVEFLLESPQAVLN